MGGPHTWLCTSANPATLLGGTSCMHTLTGTDTRAHTHPHARAQCTSSSLLSRPGRPRLLLAALPRAQERPVPGGDTGSVVPGGRAPGGMESLLPHSAQAPPSVSQDAGGGWTARPVVITTHLPAAFRKIYHVQQPHPRQQPCGEAGWGSQTESQRSECRSAACLGQNPRADFFNSDARDPPGTRSLWARSAGQGALTSWNVLEDSSCHTDTCS